MQGERIVVNSQQILDGIITQKVAQKKFSINLFVTDELPAAPTGPVGGYNPSGYDLRLRLRGVLLIRAVNRVCACVGGGVGWVLLFGRANRVCVVGVFLLSFSFSTGWR